jgi:hypothetical protein
MQEIRYDGSEELTDDVKMDALLEAIHDVENRIIAVHKPGSIIKSKDDTFYRVNKSGAWIKIKDDEIISALESYYEPK